EREVVMDAAFRSAPSARSPARLAADRLTLGYPRGAPVVADVSVAIPEGRITTIVGPNGSGKSTLLRGLVRLLAPRCGAVLLDGRSIRHRRAKDMARELGLLAQGATAP